MADTSAGIPLTGLAERLGLEPGVLAQLEDLVAEAAAAEDRAFAGGLEAALGIVPRPLRGVARGLLFPGGQRG